MSKSEACSMSIVTFLHPKGPMAMESATSLIFFQGLKVFKLNKWQKRREKPKKEPSLTSSFSLVFLLPLSPGHSSPAFSLSVSLSLLFQVTIDTTGHTLLQVQCPSRDISLTLTLSILFSPQSTQAGHF